MSNAKIIDKIRKLLGLAGNNPNAHEREEAMQKAHELLLEHHLSLEDLKEAEEEKVETFMSEVIGMAPWQRNINIAIAQLNYCKLLGWRDPALTAGPISAVFIGTATNVQVAIDIIKWLHKTVANEAKRNYHEPHRRHSFREGAAAMIACKALMILEKEKRKDLPESKSTAVALRNKMQDQIDAELNKRQKVDARTAKQQIKDKSAFKAGCDYAEGLHLGKQLGEEKPKQALEAK